MSGGGLDPISAGGQAAVFGLADAVDGPRSGGLRMLGMSDVAGAGARIGGSLQQGYGTASRFTADQARGYKDAYLTEQMRKAGVMPPPGASDRVPHVPPSDSIDGVPRAVHEVSPESFQPGAIDDGVPRAAYQMYPERFTQQSAGTAFQREFPDLFGTGDRGGWSPDDDPGYFWEPTPPSNYRHSDTGSGLLVPNDGPTYYDAGGGGAFRPAAS